MKSQLDLNLRKVLSLLHKHRQLKPVAKELGKTESAVSKHLAKLREQLDDQLFVRGAHEYEPTEFTLQLLPEVEKGLTLIKEAIEKEEFDPASYDKPITVAIPSLAQYLIGKALMLDLFDTFPKASIHLTTWSDTSVDDLLDDKIDIGLQYFNPEMTKTVYQKHLGRYKAGIVTSKKYCSKTLEEKLAMPYVLMEMKGWQEKKAVIKIALAECGIEIEKVATVDNITCLFQLLEAKECATLFPAMEHLINQDEYCVEVLPQHLQLEHPPSVVANIKVVNQPNPLHKLLADKLKLHLF